VIPIHQLLSRIRWDREFARGEFSIGYYDRVSDAIITVPLAAVQFLEGDHYFAFRVFNADGEGHSVPFHRIREVHRDGKLIWQRRA
jgi:uncharacterized protein (UPF0248 family)